MRFALLTINTPDGFQVEALVGEEVVPVFVHAALVTFSTIEVVPLSALDATILEPSLMADPFVAMEALEQLGQRVEEARIEAEIAAAAQIVSEAIAAALAATAFLPPPEPETQFDRDIDYNAGVAGALKERDYTPHSEDLESYQETYPAIVD